MLRKKITTLIVTLSLVSPMTMSNVSAHQTILGAADYNKTAFAIANQNQNKGAYIIASKDDFADALSGTMLANQLHASILFVSNKEDNEDVYAYLKQAGASNSTHIFILGGLASVNEKIEKCLSEISSNVTRLAGNDRYETCEAVLNYMNIPAGSAVTLASGKNYPDALSLGSTGIPMILTDSMDPDSVTYTELQKIQPNTVYIAGGLGSISNDIENKVRDLLPHAQIVRFAGVDRYDTSQKIASYFHKNGSVYATGKDYHDALLGCTFAYENKLSLVLDDYQADINNQLQNPNTYEIKTNSSDNSDGIVNSNSNLNTGTTTPTSPVTTPTIPTTTPITGTTTTAQTNTITGYVGLTNPVTVPVGTSLASVNMPKVIDATLSDGTEAAVPVTWYTSTTPSFDSNTPGTYTVTGAVQGYTGNIYPTMNIQVVNFAQTTSSCISVFYITSQNYIPDVILSAGQSFNLTSLPLTVSVNFDTGSVDTAMPVTWDQNDINAVNSTVPGTYIIHGTLVPPNAIIQNPRNVKAAINVVVNNAIQKATPQNPVTASSGNITSFNPLADIIAPPSIANNILNSSSTQVNIFSWLLPTTVAATLDNGNSVNLPVSFNLSNPTESSFTNPNCQTYILSGIVTLPAGVTNTNNLSPAVNIIVPTTSTSTSTTNIVSLSPVAPVTIQIGNSGSSLNTSPYMPTTVVATLANDRTVSLPIAWNINNPQMTGGNGSANYSYTGTIILPVGITNNNNLTPAVNVTLQNSTTP